MAFVDGRGAVRAPPAAEEGHARSLMQLQENVPLAPLTTIGIGGPARFFFRATSVDDMRAALALGARARAARLHPRRRQQSADLRRRLRRAWSSTSTCAASRWRAKTTARDGEGRRRASRGTLRGACAVRQRLGGHRVPVRDPRIDRRDADPERRRVRAGRQRDDRARRGARPHDAAAWSGSRTRSAASAIAPASSRTSSASATSSSP